MIASYLRTLVAGGDLAGTYPNPTFNSSVVTTAAKTVLDDASVDAMIDTLGGAAAQGTGGIVRATSPTLTTPNIGVATGTSLAATGLIKSSSSSAGVGYATGAGAAQTQLTSKATTVAVNAICGQITMHNATLNAGAEVTFNVTNSSMAALDTVIVNHSSGGTGGAYAVHAHTFSNGAFRIMVGNMTTGNLGEAIVINFSIIKAVAS